MRALAALLFLLALPSTALAGKLSKLSDPDLAKVVADRAADEDDRVEAAELLAEHRALGQAAAMVAACTPEDIPNVCEHVLASLEDMKDEPAMAAVDQILMVPGLHDGLRDKALTILRKQDPERADPRVPVLLADYRKLDPGFAVALIEYLPQRHLTAWQDITILIATDQGAKRRLRVAALEAAEAFDHPALYDAWIGMLTDEDKKIRAKCAKELGRSGLPASLVRPALMNVVQTDEAGNVRAAALGSLRFYASPELLPLLHDEVLNEKNPIAWGQAMELLEPLADASSVSTLCQLLGMQANLIDEGVVRIIHTLVRIGEPTAVPCLEALERSTQSEPVRAEARAAIMLLGGPTQARFDAMNAWNVIEIHVLDPVAPEPAPVHLGVTLDATGMAVWATVPAP
ncbi:MAG: HEAT repeat domain-containing protein [Pseudomonadota bacterium]